MAAVSPSKFNLYDNEGASHQQITNDSIKVITDVLFKYKITKDTFTVDMLRILFNKISEDININTNNKQLDLIAIILYVASFIGCGYIQKSNYTRPTFINEFINNNEKNFTWKENAKNLINEKLDEVRNFKLRKPSYNDDETPYILFLIASTLEKFNHNSTDNNYTIDNIVDKITGEFIGMKLYFNRTGVDAYIFNTLIKSFIVTYKLQNKKIIKTDPSDYGYAINPLNLKYLFEKARLHKHLSESNTAAQFSYSESKLLYNNIINRNYENEIPIDDFLYEMDYPDRNYYNRDNYLSLVTKTKIPTYGFEKNNLNFDKTNTYNYELMLQPRINFLDYVEKNVVKHVLDILYQFNFIIKRDIKQLTYPEYNAHQRKLKEKLPDIIKNFADTSLYDDFLDLAAIENTQIDMNLYVSKVSEEIKQGLEDKTTDYDGVTIVNYKKDSNILIVLNRAPYTYDDNTKISTMIRYNEQNHAGRPDKSVYKIVKRNDSAYTRYLKENVLNHFKDGKPYNFITQGGSGSGKSYTISKILKLIIGDSNNVIQNKITVAQELLSCFINARTPNNDDSSRCLTSIKHNGKSINFIVEGLECRRILTDYVWDKENFIIKDGQSEWHNSGKGNQPFHAFLSKNNTNHDGMLNKYENAKVYVIGGIITKDGKKINIDAAYEQNKAQITNSINKLHKLSLIGSLYNDLYIYLLNNPSTQKGGEIVTEGLIGSTYFLKINIGVLIDVFREFIVQDKGVNIKEFDVKNPGEDVTWFENFVQGTNLENRKADFIRFFNVFKNTEQKYNVSANDGILRTRYNDEFFEKFEITFFKETPNPKFDIDDIIKKNFTHQLKDKLEISKLKEYIKSRLNTLNTSYNHEQKDKSGTSTDFSKKKKLVDTTVKNIITKIENSNKIADIIKAIDAAQLTSRMYNSHVKTAFLPEIKSEIDNNVKNLIDDYKSALDKYIKDVNTQLRLILKRQSTTEDPNKLFNIETLKEEINTTYGYVFDYLKNSGKEFSTEKGVQALVTKYKEVLKNNSKPIKNTIIHEILQTIRPPDSSLVLQRVILAMDLYNIEVRNLCNLLTIDTSTTDIPPFDMIDIYGFEKKMTDPDDKKRTVIDTTSFVINHVNDRAMAAFLNALLNGLNAQLNEAISKKNEYDTQSYTACIAVCNYAIAFINTIVNNAFGYTVNHYDIDTSECIKDAFDKYMGKFNDENKKEGLNTQIEAARDTNPIKPGTSLFITSIHSTYELVSYIIDVYSPRGMYNINDNIKNNEEITIEDIEAYLTDAKKPPGNQRPDTTTPVKICKISYDAATNFSLKTITNIIKMFEVRNNLRDYTFVKCIKATTRVDSKKLDTEFKYEKNSETIGKSNPVVYKDDIIQDQLKNLGISLILAIEPKKLFTLFKKHPRSGDKHEQAINNLVTFIETKYYPISSSTVFTTNNEFIHELKQDTGTFTDSGAYIKNKKTGIEYYKKKYYEVKDGFTIKKFLENLFRLYDIIPKQTQE